MLRCAVFLRQLHRNLLNNQVAYECLKLLAINAPDMLECVLVVRTRWQENDTIIASIGPEDGAAELLRKALHKIVNESAPRRLNATLDILQDPEGNLLVHEHFREDEPEKGN